MTDESTPRTPSDAVKVGARTHSIRPATGCLLDLHGVREISYDEVGGVRIVFAPGGGPVAIPESEWLPTRRVLRGGPHAD